MKIRKIHFSGFKSFADSTTIDINMDMTGVVGPNGCGKSNIVDAVRWVMGRTARSIRATSVEDVIFSGTDTRKPAGQASVELVFDNEEGKIGGKYASYNEISLKRTATRGKESKYYINNTRCRQRDVADLFFGTGLGAHSYALIEQGMVTQIIEADPKEMRMYIEEAAGISKYRERRRETELRIRHTRDNLDRLLDIRDEVTKQLNKLKRQARSARQFKELRLSRDQTNGQIHFLEMKQSQVEIERCQKDLSELRIDLEKNQAQLRHYEADIEKKRALRENQNKELNDVREQFYQINAQIGGVEQDISNRSLNADQIKKEVGELSKALEQCKSKIEDEENKRREAVVQLTETKASEEKVGKNVVEIESELKEEEITLGKLSREWEQSYSSNKEANDSLEVIGVKIEYCNQELEEISKQEREVQEQKSSLNVEELERKVTELHSQRQHYREQIEKHEHSVNSKNNESDSHKDELQRTEQSAERIHSKAQGIREELVSLRALNTADGSEGFLKWLSQNNLSEASRLVSKINPEKEWESAVETVLGTFLSAVEVDSIDTYQSDIEALQSDMLVMYERSSNMAGKQGTLASKVSNDGGINVLLNQILLADDLPQAMAMRKDFTENQSAVTPEGFWVGKNWIRAHRHSDKKESILERQHMINDLERRQQETEKELQSLQEKIGKLKRQIADCNEYIDSAKGEHKTLLDQLSSAESEWRKVEALFNHAKDVHSEMDDKANQIEQWKVSINEQNAEHIKARDELVSSMPHQGEQKKKRIEADRKVTALRDQLHNVREELHQIEIQKHSLSIQLKGFGDGLSHLHRQEQNLSERQASLHQTEKGFYNPIEEKQNELNTLLDKRREYEKQIEEKTSQIEAVRVEIEQAERECRTINDDIQKLGTRRESLRIEQEKNQMHYDDYKQRIEKLDMSVEALSAQVTSEMSLENLHEELETLEKKIDKLGPINLIADQEFNELTERKEYIDSQHKDLTTALETLEKAIEKIDHESRDKFKDTFERINSRVQGIFERLFDGGTAHLELLENDWLRSGVAIMVRPPGKLLTSIRLLSGGEKALAAMAVVFSIFDLNPSPFCMLDEVDAPLDEGNVVRFCELLRDMGSRVQFIVITHNRITMEYMGSLLGITMGEPGVSRLVSVNVNEAVKIANG